jgi:hypothetical protein
MIRHGEELCVFCPGIVTSGGSFGLTAESDVGHTPGLRVSIAPGQKLYHVHKDVICYRSGDLRAAYNGSWKEGEDGVNVDFVEAGVFNMLERPSLRLG